METTIKWKYRYRCACLHVLIVDGSKAYIYQGRVTKVTDTQSYSYPPACVICAVTKDAPECCLN